MKLPGSAIVSVIYYFIHRCLIFFVKGTGLDCCLLEHVMGTWGGGVELDGGDLFVIT